MFIARLTMDNLCQFCCKPVKHAECVNIDDTFRRRLATMLDFLNLNSATLHCEDSICHGCIEKIIISYIFKKNCAQLEKDLPVLDSHGTKVDLRQLLQDKGKLEQNVQRDIQACRLCWSILYCDAVVPLTELLENEDVRTVFQEHIPEINLQAVKNPVICEICKNCLNNLKELLFLSGRFEIVREEHTNLRPEEIVIPIITEDYSGIEHVFISEIREESKSHMDMKPYVKTERDHDVFDETEQFEAKVKIEPVEIKGQPQSIVEPVQLKHEEIHIKSEDMEVDRVTTDWGRDSENEKKEKMKLHQRAESSNKPRQAAIHGCKLSSRDKSKSKVDLYKCQECPYAAKRARYLKTHMLIHKSKSEVDLYKCQECSYVTTQAGNLKKHVFIHKDKSEVDLYKCHECSYAAKRRDHLKRHMLLHKAKSEVYLHKCHECSYATKQAGNLKTHMLVHKDKSEVDLYKCHECPFATKHVACIKRHIFLVHKAKSEVHLYRCHECPFATKQAGNLKTHMLVHKDKSEVDLHNCHECPFTTKHAISLKRHMSVHKAKSEVDLHKCNECSYAARQAENLKRHMLVHLVHKAKVEVDLYKCQDCSFTTKYAGYLKKHMLVHKDKSEVELYKCRECSLATKRYADLKRHMLVHKAKSEVVLYNCQECSYAAKRADILRRHMLVHRAAKNRGETEEKIQDGARYS